MVLRISLNRIVLIITCLVVVHNQSYETDDQFFIHASASEVEEVACPAHHRDQHRPWMQQYAALHVAIMSEEAPAEMLQYVVWTCGAYGSCSGWANRMLGIASALLLAVLTDRALLIEWGDGPPLDSFVRSDYIDWRVPPAFARERTPYSHDSRLLSSATIDQPDPPRGDGQERSPSPRSPTHQSSAFSPKA